MEEQANFDKTTGIVAHITLIGWIIALVMNGEKKDEEKAFGAFYLRQVLGIFILGIGSWLVMMILAIILINIPAIGPILILLFSLAIYGGLLTLWILSLVGAVNGQKKELPVVGGMIQKMLGTAFE
ncbi:MAG: hypothetical protein A3D92_21280 [Bacteroidetes bacterium RIFCSPHIGHO2_02_FULL_44_7]|nr:MAG: hypothetical protein A3D92_21280 [Bacteroidetes bacterium RIFCSPHIGHO2_02_FULL_44_7]